MTDLKKLLLALVLLFIFIQLVTVFLVGTQGIWVGH